MLTTTSSRARQRRLLLPFVAAMTVALAGCGGSGGDASTTPAGDESDSARVKLQQCLRDNGVDIPDNAGQGGGGAPRSDIDMEAVQEAMNGPCKELQSEAFGDVSSADREEFQDAFQQFAQCMRDEGIDIPEVTPGEGGGPGGGAGAIDRDDPEVQAAMESCQDELPQGGGLRPGGQ
ncbi:MAG: hypothetical protein JHD16_08330 [Solirubrobacteraceae bacterium]|nr:hypothetical protein [Solirubrobacteraceae bacterium]